MQDEGTRWLIIIGWAQLIVFAAQLAVFWYQALKLRQTVKAAADQSVDMKESIAQATRAANAMEISASAMTINSQTVTVLRDQTARQMRAYLCVNVGGGVYQESSRHLRFEVKPILVNTGHTPAHHVSYSARAEVFPFPLPNDFAVPAIKEQTGFSGAGILGPQQNFILNAIEERYFDDAEVEDIMRGKGRRLYIWGTVRYQDVFGERHFTNFFHSIYWVKTPEGERVSGTYQGQHSEAD